MANGTPTFMIRQMDTFSIKVELAIPPERPVMKGHLMVEYFTKSKDEVKNLADQNYEDSEFFDQIVKSISGLGDASGNLLESDAALEEAKGGKLSMYMVPAIVGAYFDQYGEARRKNSKTSPRR